MRSALITGINGFVGSHLTHHLLEKGYRVTGVDRHTADTGKLHRELLRYSTVDPALLESVEFHTADLSREGSLTALFRDRQFNFIYHLAGAAFVPFSWENPVSAIESNLIATVRLIQAAREARWKGRILIVSSSDVYGSPDPKHLPITESFPPVPESPYAASKRAAEEFALLFNQEGIEILIARPFNHIGPGQSLSFVVPAFLNRIREAKNRGETIIHVGDLDSGRDFTDVRDVVQAYRILMEKGHAGETYNICTGRMRSVREILDMALSVTGTDITIQVDPSLLRPEGPTFRYGSAIPLQRLGWKPEIPVEQSIRDMWDYLNRMHQK